MDSAAAHVEGRKDRLVTASPLSEIVGDWREFLNSGIGAGEAEILRLHERTGRPLGSEDFITRLESELARVLHRRKPGPKGNWVWCTRNYRAIQYDCSRFQCYCDLRGREVP